MYASSQMIVLVPGSKILSTLEGSYSVCRHGLIVSVPLLWTMSSGTENETYCLGRIVLDYRKGAGDSISNVQSS